MQSQTPRVSYQLRLRSTLVANSASENNCCPDLPRFDEALSGIIHQYAIEYSYRKNELLDHVLQFPDNTVHDPVKIQTRGMPAGRSTRTTRRDSSQFERVENQLEAPLQRRGRNCKREGHNARACIEGRV